MHLRQRPGWQSQHGRAGDPLRWFRPGQRWHLSGSGVDVDCHIGRLRTTCSQITVGVVLCGNYGEDIRVACSTAMRRNCFLFCVSSLSIRQVFIPLTAARNAPCWATGRPVSLGFRQAWGRQVVEKRSGARRHREDDDDEDEPASCYGLR
jgi:hypothetical protein